jgi:hypothetical protein
MFGQLQPHHGRRLGRAQIASWRAGVLAGGAAAARELDDPSRQPPLQAASASTPGAGGARHEGAAVGELASRSDLGPGRHAAAAEVPMGVQSFARAPAYFLWVIPKETYTVVHK